ncbi:C6 zinc finger domain protein [Colletotrichum plurivorum]|uniref:C6 zinc finger domain protein n=1 Tax=Colletotrichum plurivorum TaxID=2175906 RepID=A0A8H6JS40_9PEZI|nr:C6 zinc finger domain protein [Colletotrichum plurivorum]
MTLGPQCWRCRKRRLRCDSSHPSCLKCASAGTPCPGYGEKRPIAWRDPFVLTPRGVVRIRETSGGLPGSASVMGIVCRAPRSVGSELELRITVDAISYYNIHVAPDLVPYATHRSPYQISPSEVGELAEYLRKVYISIAALHKYVSGEPSAIAQFASDTSRSIAVRNRARSSCADISELMATGDFKSVHFAAQVAALRALNEELQKHHSGDSGDLEPGTLLGIMLVLSSQIQYSAYAPWQAHIHGAWCLITAQGGVEALARKNQDHCRVLQQVAVVDIFGMSTHRLTTSSAEIIIARHASYALIFDKATADVLNPWTLMPNDLAKILDRINVLRAQNFLAPSATSQIDGFPDVLRTLDEVSPDSWAAEVAMNATFWLTPGKLSDDAESKAAWRALMEAFLHATVLYAINSLAGIGFSTRLNSPDLIGREITAYETLMSAIRLLFRQRADRKHSSRSNPSDSATSAGLLHKFVIWPMVVGGIQAALIHRDEAATKYLCAGMQSIGEELGTVSMIDGARLVAKLWSSGHGPASWDDIFDGAPLFLM